MNLLKNSHCSQRDRNLKQGIGLSLAPLLEVLRIDVIILQWHIPAIGLDGFISCFQALRDQQVRPRYYPFRLRLWGHSWQSLLLTSEYVGLPRL